MRASVLLTVPSPVGRPPPQAVAATLLTLPVRILFKAFFLVRAVVKKASALSAARPSGPFPFKLTRAS